MDAKERDELIRRVADWLDPFIVAETIVAGLEAAQEEVSFENCVDFWIWQMQEMHDRLELMAEGTAEC
jgi:hypothetical protein